MKKFQVFLEERGWEGTQVESPSLPNRRDHGDFKGMREEILKQIAGKQTKEAIEHLEDLERKALNRGDYDLAEICKQERWKVDPNIAVFTRIPLKQTGHYSEE